jgi:hypothetical protein
MVKRFDHRIPAAASGLRREARDEPARQAAERRKHQQQPRSE